MSTALSRLKDRELVQHKAEYWAVTTDENRVEESSEYERATAILSRQLGAEESRAWREHTPDGPHPGVDDES